MLYSLPESGHPIVLLLLVTLFPIFCSLVLSLISLLPCPLFCFLVFFLCPYNFPAFFSPYRCFTLACCFFSLLAARLHFCSSLCVPIRWCGEIHWISPHQVSLVTTKLVSRSRRSQRQTGKPRLFPALFSWWWGLGFEEPGPPASGVRGALRNLFMLGRMRA